MYGKVFESIYKGTLYGQWEAIVTMQQLIVLADADGFVDMTPMAISAQTSIPREILDKGLEILAAPDKFSRTPGSEGRRIELIDEHRPWGWFLINYAKYRDLKDHEEVRRQTRERVRKHRESKKKVNDVTLCNKKKRHKDKDKDTNTDKPKTLGHSVTADFERWWSGYPKKVKKKTAFQIWQRKKPDADILIADVQNRLLNDGQWLGGFIPHPTTYLNGERWNDELTPVERPGSSRRQTYAEKLAADMRDKGML